MSKVALIIIYNHQYNRNIATLEAIYRDRFSCIYHLVPFYQGAQPNVIPVYENSFYFQGYVAQGFRHFFGEQFEHYFFVADDLFLNPSINENNYAEHLRLSPRASFIPGIISLHEVDTFWPRVPEAYSYRAEQPGIEAAAQLPDHNAALARFQRFGLALGPLRHDQIWERAPLFPMRSIRQARDTLRAINGRHRKYALPYPLAGAYSDIFVISSCSIRQFSHYCGVTAATRLFVEVGLPTSLILCAEELVTEADLTLKGKALWTKEDLSTLDRYGNSLPALAAGFPSGLLYLHPVKLSKWHTTP